MKKTFRFLTLLLVLGLLLLPAGSAYAQGPGPGDGRVIFGSNYTIEGGDVFEGDLVVFGGNVTIEEDAQLNGDLVVIGGRVESSGEVTGDVLIVGGLVVLEETAVVGRDVVTVGGQLESAEGATIQGDIVNNAAPPIDIPNGSVPPVPAVPDVPSPSFNFSFNPFGEIFWAVFWAVSVAAFAMLIALFWQPQVERAGTLIVTQPVMAGAYGLLAVVVGVILFITIIPPLIVAFAWLFGIVAIGSEVGARFTKATNQTWSPVLTIGLGTFLLVLVSGALGFIPCLGGLLQFALGLLGIGGAVLTWFGSRVGQVPGLPVAGPPAESNEAPPQQP